MEKEIKKQAEDKMRLANEVLKKELSTIRTGRASLSILDNIMVDAYGSAMPLSQVATLNVPEGRTITIQPWDNKMLSAIEKSIQKSDLGLTPSNDGHMIRLSIPSLTEERRKELVKVVKKRAEDTKIAHRNIRRDANEHLKKLEKDEHLSKDDVKKALDEVQKLTDTFAHKVDEIVSHKEKEIMEV